MRISFLGIVWLVIGLFVALNHGYAASTLPHFLSLIVAILLWPLVLLFGWPPHILLGS